jgi:hypothetical protein
MNTTTIIKLTLAGVVGIAFTSVSSAYAQSTLGGAKTQQSKIGGIAKPPPVVGGAVIHTPAPTPPKVGSVVNIAKPGSVGTPTPGSMGAMRPGGQTAGSTGAHPPFTPPNKGGTVVTASSNLKCANGACASRGPKP